MIWWLCGLAWALPSLDEPHRTGASSADAAVVISLEDYAFVADVPHAAHDGAVVRDAMVYTLGLAPERVFHLTAGGREQILEAVTAAGALVGPGGRVWLTFSGHGAAHPTTGARLILGDDVRSDVNSFGSRGVAVDELVQLASANGAQPLLMLDTCYTGVGRSGDNLLGGARLAVPVYAAPPPTGAVWTAASANQVAGPLDEVQHGAFTYLTVGALRGWADGELSGSRDGAVDAGELEAFVARGLAALQQRQQVPEWAGPRPPRLSAGTEPAPDFAANGMRQDPPVAQGQVPPPAPSVPEPKVKGPPDLGWLVTEAALVWGGTRTRQDVELDLDPIGDGEDPYVGQQVSLGAGGSLGVMLRGGVRPHPLIEVVGGVGLVSALYQQQVDGCYSSQTSGCEPEEENGSVWAPRFDADLRARIKSLARLQFSVGTGLQRVVGTPRLKRTVTYEGSVFDDALSPGEIVEVDVAASSFDGAWVTPVRLGIGADLIWPEPVGWWLGLTVALVPGAEAFVDDTPDNPDSSATFSDPNSPVMFGLETSIRWAAKRP